MIKTDLTESSEGFLESFHSVDYKDMEGLFEEIDNELKRFDLELDLGNNADDSYWFRIIKRIERKLV